MTRTEILQFIKANDYVDEFYEILRQIREDRYKRIIAEASEAKATLRLIKKVSKDKVVQDILSEGEEE